MSDGRTLPGALADAARGDEGYIFLANGLERRRTYAELFDDSLRVARALAEAGLARGDVVALVVADAEQFLTALFGAAMAGVVPASLYPPATLGELTRYLDTTTTILRAAGARGVVTSEALRPAFDALRGRCPDLEVVLSRDALDAPPARLERWPSPDDIAFVQFTSGSTSTPKGVALTHRNLCANIDAINGPSGLGSSSADVAVSWLPLYHDMGLVGMALCALYCARPAVLLAAQTFVKRPAEWLRAIARHRGTISFAPNFGYDLCVRRVRARDLDDLDLSSWRVAGCGSEPIYAPTLAAFAEKFAPAGFRETSFLPSYGLAEHVVAATFAARDCRPRIERVDGEALTEGRRATPAAEADPSAVTIVACGRGLPGHAIRIVDESERMLPERHVGEITLAGPSVMLGYYKDDALTRRTIRDGWLHTGDLGYIADGELFVCGRLKDVIIVNGRKYHPQDLEWAVDDLPGVRRGRVVAFGAGRPGGPDAVVIVAEPSGTSRAGEVRDAIRRRVVDLCGLYVDDVVLVSSGTIGRTTSGKVQRAATRALYERGELTDADAGAPTVGADR